MAEKLQSASGIAQALTEAVAGRKDAQQVTGLLRALSTHAPSTLSTVVYTLLPALRWLRANKKAGWENKAIAAVHEALSAAALAGVIDEVAAAAVIEATLPPTSGRNDGPQRQLAALRLCAEIVALVPGIKGAK